MLKQRLLTALVLIPLVLWAILALSTRQFAFVLLFVVVLGAWEWSRLSGIKVQALRFAYASGVGLAAFALLFAIPRTDLTVGILVAAFAWWLYSFFLVLRYRGRDDRGSALKALEGLVVLAPAWLGLVLLHGRPAGPQLVIFLMLLIWTADIAAYFVGRAWGHRKLAPHVSPGKSWEGFGGAFFFTAVLALAGGLWFHKAGASLAGFVVVCLVTVVFSVIGDLTESLVKRQAGVKDRPRFRHTGQTVVIQVLDAAPPVMRLSADIERHPNHPHTRRWFAAAKTQHAAYHLALVRRHDRRELQPAMGAIELIGAHPQVLSEINCFCHHQFSFP